MAYDNEHYLLIGAVSANWSALEHVMNEALWELSGLSPEIGVCFTAQIPNIGRRYDALAAIAKQKGASAETLKTINKVYQKSDALQRQRNRIIHDPWRFNYETNTAERLQVSAFRGEGVTIEFKPITNDEIEEFASTIGNHIREIQELLRKIKADARAQLPASSDTQSPQTSQKS